MRISFLRLAIVACIAILPWSAQAQESEIEVLKAAVEELRADYDARIADLERRLAIAEQNARQASYKTPQSGAVPTAVPSAAAASSAFNPAIGVILQGQAWNYSGSAQDDAVQGFPYGGEAGPVSEGLASG